MSALYFVAVLPPADLAEEITQFKRYCHAHYGSGHALRSPPHITLHMPFKWKDQKRPDLEACLQEVAEGHVPFQVELCDFDYFEPRVVFVDVLENRPLRDLQQQLTSQMRRDLHLFNAEYKDRPYHPHMTIAFRDLKKPKFYEAKAHFSTQSLSAIFDVQDMVLLKHNGREWEVDKRFAFGS